ncbi:MAG: hypothetical protein IPK87_01950 [Planctomycetes bacterium]|nr:hypothetical protein [Planctomycetota bacterium]
MARIDIHSQEVTTLLTRIEEATRSTEEGVQFFVEPAEDALRRALSKRHHIIFGRRGSGKSSLLRKVQVELARERRPVAWVDLEAFKGHSYPDLLISVLMKTLEEFKVWLETAATAPANKSSFWNKVLGVFGKPNRPPFNKTECHQLIASIDEHLKALSEQLHSADDASIQRSYERRHSVEESLKADVAVKAEAVRLGASTSVSAEGTLADSSHVTHAESYKRSKVEFLRRHVMNFQRVFKDMARLSASDSFLILDDLYHLRRSEQPLVLDYLHSIAKGNNLWLKVGTIKHRSSWYVHGSPPLGMKLGDDADEIDLDLTLEKYSIAKSFLRQILQNLSRSASLPDSLDFLTDTGLDRLVLASGGVARDFLAIFRRSVVAARERGRGSSRGDRIGAEDVNVAAGEFEPTKREEFKRDTYGEDEPPLEKVFQAVRRFCLETANSNCFLVDKEVRGSDVEAIHELVDLKLLHLIRSRVTVSKRQGRIFEAYMLDLSQYAGSRKKRDLELIEFWSSDSTEQLRKASLIYSGESN